MVNYLYFQYYNSRHFSWNWNSPQSVYSFNNFVRISVNYNLFCHCLPTVLRLQCLHFPNTSEAPSLNISLDGYNTPDTI